MPPADTACLPISLTFARLLLRLPDIAHADYIVDIDAFFRRARHADFLPLPSYFSMLMFADFAFSFFFLMLFAAFDDRHDAAIIFV